MSEERPPPAFAGLAGQQRDALMAAPVRWPRPSKLAASLELVPPRVAEAAAALGLHTIGDLLEHLPRDRREARTIAALQAGEQATVVVEVRSIRTRPVRRRGMRPLVEATVADATGQMKVAVFHQPWPPTRYPPGARPGLHAQ